MFKKDLQILNFSIKNQGSGTVDVHIDGDIVDASTQEILKAWWGDETSVSYKSFRNEVEKANPQVVNVFINCNGGHVGDAMAIHDFLNALEAKGVTVNRKGRGIIASAGTFILVGNNSEMSENSFMMIHNVSMVAFGDINQVENQARAGRKFNDRIRDFYSAQTGMRKEEITKMMDSETWMTAAEAKEKKFVSNVSQKVEFTNAIKPENWLYNNTSVLNTYNSAVKPAPENTTSLQNQIDDMKKFWNDFKDVIANAIKNVKVDDKTTHESLRNAIAEAVGKTFEGVGDQMETAVNDSVNTAVASKTVNDAIALQVKNAVEAATKDLTTKITNLETAKGELEKKNKDLETEIENKIGNKSQANANEKEVVPIGSFQ